MRVTITTAIGEVDVRTPGGFSPDVLDNVAREAIRLLAAMYAVAGLTEDEDTEVETVAE